MSYGDLDKLPPSLQGGVNPNLYVRITLDEVNLERFNPPYNGPGVVVRLRTTDSLEMVVDRIIPVRREDTKPFVQARRDGTFETLEEAIRRREVEVSTRIAHWMSAFGVTRAQVDALPNSDSFEGWAESALALLPAGYEDTPVAVKLVYLTNGMLWSPKYLGKTKAFVNTDPHKLRVEKGDVITAPLQTSSGDATPVAGSDPW